MSYQSQELYDSRQITGDIDNKSILMKWIIWGGDDASETDAYAFVTGNSGTPGLAPYVMDGLNRASVKLKNVAGPGGIWLADVTYGSQPTIACLDVQYDFPQYGSLATNFSAGIEGDGTGKTAHITQGLSTLWKISGGSSGDIVASGTDLSVTSVDGSDIDGTADVELDGSPPAIEIGSLIVIGQGQGWTPGPYTVTAVSGTTLTLDGVPGPSGTSGGSWTIYSPTVNTGGGSAPDFGNAIGVSVDSVAGTDVLIPSFEFTIPGAIAPFSVDQMKQFYPLIGTINADSFWGFAQGEARYDGFTFKSVDGNLFRIVHRFTCQPSQYNIVVTSKITVPYKAGFDYLWVYYGPSTNKNTPIQIALAAYVVKVYPDGDFTQLGLG